MYTEAHTNPTATSSKTPASPAQVTAVYFLVLFLCYALLLRVVNFVILYRATGGSWTPFSPPFSLPFILGEELILGTVMALVLILLWKTPVLRVFWLAVLGLYFFALALDQLAFKVFFSHVDYILYTSSHDFVRLWSSIAGSFDAIFVLNVILAALCTVLIFISYRPVFIRVLANALVRRPTASVLIGIAYLAVSFSLSIFSEQHQLDRSLPLTYGRSYILAQAEDVAEEQVAIPSEPRPPRVVRSVVGTDNPADGLATVRAAIADGPKKLNVVWYFMESASYRETSIFPENSYDTTPFLKELAEESLLFTNYYTSFAASTRSFISALTGLHTYVDNSANAAKYAMLKVPNLVDILHQQGYTTGFFSSSDTLFDSLDNYLTNRAYDIYMDKNLLPQDESHSVSIGSWGVDEEIMIDHALDWIQTVKDSGKPFFVNYNAVYPHHPFRVPRKHRDLNKMDWGNEEGLKPKYRASLYYADMAVRRFYEGLKRLNVAGNTLFIVTSDHGEAFGDLHAKNLIHAEFCYDEDSHLFLILHNPGALGQPVQSDRLGSHADLLPTILHILGISRELPIDGQSLLSSVYEEPIIYCFSRRQIGVRDGDLKFLTMRRERQRELYDLSKDPQEQDDISRDNPDKVAAYEKMARGWKARVSRAYRDRIAATGLTKKETQRLASRRRNKIFGGVQARIDSAAICQGGACDAGFKKGQPLTVRVRVKKPGYLGLLVELFDPAGKKIYKNKTRHTRTNDMVSAELPAHLFQTGGNYRARVLLLSSHAVHDSTNLRFRIND
ncbi:MAG: sulfatase-like hydrolase/transferase [Proteobacteria bacterium]|nr:sulfatase-like hydrolase/transferase [Pseudomonadota bacterium]